MLGGFPSNYHREADSKWVEQAVALACQEVKKGGIPFGALVVDGGALIGTGVNRVRQDRDPTAHAEIVAIRSAAVGARGSLQGSATLYASGEPCALCLLGAYWAGISRIVFAADRNEAARAGFDYRPSYELLAEERLPISRLHCRVTGALKPFDLWRERSARNGSFGWIEVEKG